MNRKIHVFTLILTFLGILSCYTAEAMDPASTGTETAVALAQPAQSFLSRFPWKKSFIFAGVAGFAYFGYGWYQQYALVNKIESILRRSHIQSTNKGKDFRISGIDLEQWKQREKATSTIEKIQNAAKNKMIYDTDGTSIEYQPSASSEFIQKIKNKIRAEKQELATYLNQIGKLSNAPTTSLTKLSAIQKDDKTISFKNETGVNFSDNQKVIWMIDNYSGILTEDNLKLGLPKDFNWRVNHFVFIPSNILKTHFAPATKAFELYQGLLNRYLKIVKLDKELAFV